MASGIAVSDKCVTAYAALSKRSSGVVILRINETMTDVEVDKTLPPPGDDAEAEWKSFIKSLPSEDCRYVIADFAWKVTPTVTKSKVISILWSPDNSSIKQKMIYASSQEAVLNKMSVQHSIQANDTDDLDYKAIKDTIAK